MRIPDGLGREQLVKEHGTVRCQPGRLPEIAPSAGCVSPVAAGILIQDNSAKVDRTRGGNLHDRIVVRLGLAAKLIHAFRIVSFGRKREDVTRLCEEKPVQNGLAQLIRFLLQGIVLNTAGGQEESGDYQQGGPWDHMQDRGIRKAVDHQQEDQGGQCRQSPGNH